ncbi:Immunity protein Imm1 [Saccharopolyspora shandongensis]|uniref:Immunity protein Imm1 n=2 Tax=Saccharopolyspora shandongensis TaxID=418495 RepID=A0A1H3CHX0_9PSEU|nr:Immunity protein Imm1 [Saccharopolyspora shandongensis]
MVSDKLAAMLSTDLPTYVDPGWRHASSSVEMEQAISDALDKGDCNTAGWLQFGRDVAADQPGDHQLRVVADPGSGYAALLWFLNVDPEDHLGDPLAQHLWVTFNPAPPLEAPRLASDYDTDHYHDRFTVIPIEQAREALREFCRSGGQRPTSVQWVAGDYYGRIMQRLAVAGAA